MKWHNRLAHSFGYELIKLRKHPTSDSHLINLINHYRIDLVLDVGANRGQFGQSLREAGYQGVLHSFEPASSTFRQLQAAAGEDAHWHVHHCALGAEPGELELNVSASSDLSSFLAANDYGREKYQRIEVSETEKVAVHTLDGLLPELVPDWADRSILLKMDTQGFDLQVFAGAAKVADGLQAILSELSLIPIYEGMPHYLEALRCYEQAGFCLTGLYPISRADDLAVIEMDCFMIRRP